jgi:hypothetical protein
MTFGNHTFFPAMTTFSLYRFDVMELYRRNLQASWKGTASGSTIPGD